MSQTKRGGLLLVALLALGCRGALAEDRPFSPWVTRLMYNQLQVGMGEQQILKIVGRAPERTSEMRDNGMPRMVYLWVNPDRTSMSVVLQDARLVSKSADFKPTTP